MSEYNSISEQFISFKEGIEGYQTSAVNPEHLPLTPDEQVELSKKKDTLFVTLKLITDPFLILEEFDQFEHPGLTSVYCTPFVPFPGLEEDKGIEIGASMVQQRYMRLGSLSETGSDQFGRETVKVNLLMRFREDNNPYPIISIQGEETDNGNITTNKLRINEMFFQSKEQRQSGTLQPQITSVDTAQTIADTLAELLKDAEPGVYINGKLGHILSSRSVHQGDQVFIVPHN